MSLKPWMQVCIWLGLGGSVGFFGGYQVGTVMERKNQKKIIPMPERRPVNAIEVRPASVEDPKEIYRRSQEAMLQYRGGDTDGDTVFDLSDPNLRSQLVIDPQEMEMETYTETKTNANWHGFNDIPDLHPEDMTPYPITEEEYNLNEKDLDKDVLLFYEYDEVLYNPRTKETIDDQDGLLGIGALMSFYGDPNNPTEVIYIVNETMGFEYEVQLIHGAFIDVSEGSMAPQEEPGEELPGSEDISEQDTDPYGLGEDENEENW